MAQLLFFSLVNNEKLLKKQEYCTTWAICNLFILFDHTFLGNFLFFSFLCSQKDKFLNVEQPESAQNSGNAFASEPSSHSCVRFHQLFSYFAFVFSLTSLVKSIKKSINFLSKENESFLCFNLFIFALVSHSVHWQWNNFVTWESERDFGSWGWVIQFSILRYIHTFAHTHDTNERKSRSSNYIDFGVQWGVWSVEGGQKEMKNGLEWITFSLIYWRVGGKFLLASVQKSVPCTTSGIECRLNWVENQDKAMLWYVGEKRCCQRMFTTHPSNLHN